MPQKEVRNGIRRPQEDRIAVEKKYLTISSLSEQQKGRNASSLSDIAAICILQGSHNTSVVGKVVIDIHLHEVPGSDHSGQRGIPQIFAFVPKTDGMPPSYIPNPEVGKRKSSTEYTD